MLDAHNPVSLCAREIQLFIGSSCQPYEQIANLKRLVERLPRITRETDRVLIRGLLLDFTLEWSERCHRMHHTMQDCGPVAQCPLRLDEITARIWREHRRDPLSAMRRCASDVTAAFVRAHPEVLALQLRDEIDTRYAEPLATLIADITTDAAVATRIRKQFPRVVGQTPLEYQTRCRVAAAQRLLVDGSDKMEVIARAVGWKSPKDLYRAIYDATGKTPAEIRLKAAKDGTASSPDDGPREPRRGSSRHTDRASAADLFKRGTNQ